MEWVTDVANGASKAFNATATYFSNNEWAANALAGAAAGGAAYLMQKDQQDFQRREADKAWDRKVSLAKGGDVDMAKYDWSDLSSGGLTDGGLISQAKR